MGYTTEFYGEFKLNKKLDSETYEFLDKLAATRRMKRRFPSEYDKIYGVEGEFYVGDDDSSIVEMNMPPKTQPGLWLQWVPAEDGMSIVWDGSEKFYNYIEWIRYLIEKILKPRGYVLNGEVDWQGESPKDIGKIQIKNNQIRIFDGVFKYKSRRRL